MYQCMRKLYVVSLLLLFMMVATPLHATPIAAHMLDEYINSKVEPKKLSNQMINGQKAIARERQRKIESIVDELRIELEDVKKIVQAFDDGYNRISDDYTIEFSTQYTKLLCDAIEGFRKLAIKQFNLRDNEMIFILTGSAAKGTVRRDSSDIDLDILVDGIVDLDPGYEDRISQVAGFMSIDDLRKIDNTMTLYLALMTAVFGKVTSDEVVMYQTTNHGFKHIMISDEYLKHITSANAAADPNTAKTSTKVDQRLMGQIIFGEQDFGKHSYKDQTARDHLRTALYKRIKPRSSVENFKKLESKWGNNYYRLKEIMATYEGFVDFCLTEFGLLDMVGHATMPEMVDAVDHKLVELAFSDARYDNDPLERGELAKAYVKIFSEIQRPPAGKDIVASERQEVLLITSLISQIIDFSNIDKFVENNVAEELREQKRLLIKDGPSAKIFKTAENVRMDNAYSSLPSFVTIEFGGMEESVSKKLENNTILRTIKEINTAKQSGKKYSDYSSCSVLINVPSDIVLHSDMKAIDEDAVILKKALASLYVPQEKSLDEDTRDTAEISFRDMIEHSRFGFKLTEEFYGLEYNFNPAFFDGSEDAGEKIMYALYFLTSVIVHHHFYDGDQRLKEIYEQFPEIEERIGKNDIKGLRKVIESMVNATSEYCISKDQYIMADQSRINGQVTDNVELIEVGDMYENKNGYVMPTMYSAEHGIDEAIWTDSLGSCSALVVIADKRDELGNVTRVHKMLHCTSEKEGDKGKEELKELKRLGDELAAYDLMAASTEFYVYEGNQSTLKKDIFGALGKLGVSPDRINVVKEENVLRKNGKKDEDISDIIKKYGIGKTRGKTTTKAIRSKDGKVYLPYDDVDGSFDKTGDNKSSLDESKAPDFDIVHYKSA